MRAFAIQIALGTKRKIFPYFSENSKSNKIPHKGNLGY